MAIIIISIVLIVVLIGALVVVGSLRTKVAVLEQDKRHAEENAAALTSQYERQTTELKEHHREQMEGIKSLHEEQLAKVEEQYRQSMNDLRRQQAEQLAQQMQLIKEQMNTTSERILKERAEQLSSTNKEQLASILNPLQTNIQQMREAVEKSDREHNTTMARLDATIKTSIEQSREVGERADKLAQALTGENKTQGNFGELRLKQLLEGMGLVEGEQFDLQETMRDKDGKAIQDDGHRLIPDAILHFPDQRDLIIDSKMSFTAYEEYYNAETEEQRQDALKRHILSMRNHVNELSKKSYAKFLKEGRGKLDFVLMYVFSEPALQLALSNEPTLWKYAYDKGVIITGSQNLYVMLRVLEMTWKQVRQVENQQQIMDLASEMVERVQTFAERFAEVKKQFEKTADAIADVERSTADGGQSIVTSARKLLKMGASENAKKKSIANTSINDK